MAVSSSKSSSKRGNLTNSSSNVVEKSSTKKDAHSRRSRSVSAFYRSNSSDSVVVDSGFVNTRDNPLFAANGSCCGGDGGRGGGDVPPLLECDVGSKMEKGVGRTDNVEESWLGCGGAAGCSRGRSVARSSSGSGSGDGMLFLGNREENRRSLSRVDTGRRARSVSVRPASRHHSESEVEHECSSSSNCSMSYFSGIGKSIDGARNYSDLSDGPESPKTWCSQHPPSIKTLDTSKSCVQTPNWEVGGLPSSSWRAEDISNTAVYHQMKEDCLNVEDDSAATGIYETVRLEVRRAMSDIQLDLETAIRGNNEIFTTSNNGDDATADFFYPGATGLILDIRSEYAKELEQSNERARKLREDLVVEEQRGIEINRIMKELLPEQKTPSLQRSRPARKRSIERRKMSKSLAKEAMTYFDECVSISTFDSSDFSSQEDPAVKLFGATTIALDRASIPPGSSSASTTDSPRSYVTNQEIGIGGQQMHVLRRSGLTASSNSNQNNYDSTNPDGTNAEESWPFRFSFVGKPSGYFGLPTDISKYVKKFEKGGEKDRIDLDNTVDSKSHRFDLEEYNLQVPSQSFLLDKVTYKNRIESGSILFCGSFPFSVSSYPHVL